jgi:hypothetical protein
MVSVVQFCSTSVRAEVEVTGTLGGLKENSLTAIPLLQVADAVAAADAGALAEMADVAALAVPGAIMIGANGSTIARTDNKSLRGIRCSISADSLVCGAARIVGPVAARHNGAAANARPSQIRGRSTWIRQQLRTRRGLGEDEYV